MRTISAPSSSKKSQALDRVSKQLCNEQVQSNVCSNYVYSANNQCMVANVVLDKLENKQATNTVFSVFLEYSRYFNNYFQNKITVTSFSIVIENSDNTIRSSQSTGLLFVKSHFATPTPYNG